MDRFSKLPDCIMHHIMSYLSAKEVAQISSLSKRLKGLSESFPIFDFSDSYFHIMGSIRLFRNHERYLKRVHKFVDFVDASLSRFSDLNLRMQKFSLMIHVVADVQQLSPVLENWIRSAIECGVEELDLYFFFSEHEEIYTLPQILFSSKSMNTIKLNACKLEQPSNNITRLLSLKRLTLNDVCMQEETIQKLIDHCPLLEDFSLEECWGFNRFYVAKAHKLKTIKIRTSTKNELISTIRIVAPSLQEFKLRYKLEEPITIDMSGCPNLKELRLSYVTFTYQEFHSLTSNFPLLELKRGKIKTNPNSRRRLLTMNSTVHRTPKSGRNSLFFQDLASPISASRGKFSSPGQAAAVSALWRENFGGSDLPPPPMYTLEDRSDYSPESGILDYPVSPEIKSGLRTPAQSSGRDVSSTPVKGRSEASTSFAVIGGQQNQQGSTSVSWWSPGKVSSSEQEEKGRGSPVEGVVQPGALITLPPPREVARPEMQKTSLPAGNLNEEEWVTVYGFSPADTNLVLREFEKCGVILKHVPGPREANWMHILYQNRADAQKALSKNGMQINGVLIVGVKPVDPMQRHVLNERLNNQGFMTFPPPSSRNSELNSLRSSPRPYYLQNGSTNARQSGGSIASPTKSLVSKVMDLMFGI
ncbi:hypothetical protein LWI29_014189 [Acer saccharum]|uniref:Nuclear pore complex protein NUP35 n=2 Tax=Acer TaxID=4022 RepID=A0AA39VYV1_ACESA|nr:hypothetical protein LWI29_014189 [Acer saccharum]